MSMKIVHTSDWHLGHRLYNYDRADEEARFFAALNEIVARERPDALIVSGDVFHTGAPGNDVAKSFTDGLLAVTATCPTMETVIIAGNHDSYSRLTIDQSLWRTARVHVFGVPAEHADGSADFAANVIEIGNLGVIAAVPFCHARNFPTVPGAAGEDRQRNYFNGLADYVQAQTRGRPSVLMAHLAVSGQLDLRGHDASLVIGGEECVGVEELGGGYDYVALGHIHCPQWVAGKDMRKRVRYCGTPRSIHFDETYAHGIDVVTVEPGSGPVVRSVAIEPMRALKTIGGEDGLDFESALQTFAATDLPDDAYVRFNVRLAADALPGADWKERARKACADRGLRFCVINPIREAAPENNEVSHRKLTMEELKELSDDEVLTILSAQHPLSDRQRELLGGLLRDLAAEKNK